MCYMQDKLNQTIHENVTRAFKMDIIFNSSRTYPKDKKAPPHVIFAAVILPILTASFWDRISKLFNDKRVLNQLVPRKDQKGMLINPEASQNMTQFLTFLGEVNTVIGKGERSQENHYEDALTLAKAIVILRSPDAMTAIIERLKLPMVTKVWRSSSGLNFAAAATSRKSRISGTGSQTSKTRGGKPPSTSSPKFSPRVSRQQLVHGAGSASGSNPRFSESAASLVTTSTTRAGSSPF